MTEESANPTQQFPDDTPLTTTRPSPIGGLGVFTTTAIPPGTLLLSEPPILTVPEPRTPTTVHTAFTHLTPSQQTTCLSLYAQHPHTPTRDLINDIFNSNAWQTGSATSLLPNAARFNHSCVPNACFSWDARRTRANVRAVSHIAAGDEVTLSYTLPYAPSAVRRARLAHYGFVCACAACLCPASDVRRARMVVLESRVRVAKKQTWRVTMPRAAMELVRLLREEGLVGEALGLGLHEVAVGWRTWGRLDLAVRYARREREVAGVCFGEGREVEGSERFLSELEREMEEGAREKAEVGVDVVKEEVLVGSLEVGAV